ncbi:glycosyltransferase family 4 protein [Patescibacteria group bacterium]|nr:glycosyltransferase family 4 protein [Patescibacteria group bacterium]
MKVLIISHAYTASYNRRDKLSRLSKHKQVDELAVVIPRNWRDRMQEISRKYEKVPADDSYRVYQLDPYFNSVQNRYLYCSLKLSQVVKEFKPDIIHVEQELHDWLLWEVVLLNRLFWHRKLVVFVWENIARRFNPIKRLVIKFVAAQVSHFICGNQAATGVVKRYSRDRQFTVLPQFGVDTQRFSPLDVTDLKRDLKLENKFIIGFVGRYVKEKGIHTLMAAIEELAREKSIPEFNLVLISSMQPPEWLKQQAQGLGGKVHFASSVPHEDFPRYMNLLDVLVLPSETQNDWKEQFGRVMVEAMACGVPVVGSSSGAIPEVVGKYGLIFQEQDFNDLAQKLNELMTDSDKLKQLKKEVRPYVVENLTHEMIAQKTVEVWQKIYENSLS